MDEYALENNGDGNTIMSALNIIPGKNSPIRKREMLIC